MTTARANSWHHFRAGLSWVVLLFFALASLVLAASAGKVRVSDRSVTVYSDHIEVKPRDAAIYQFDGRKAGDVVTITLLPNIGTQRWAINVMTDAQLNRWRPGLGPQGQLATEPPLTLRYISKSSNPIHVLLMNMSSQEGTARYRLSFERRVSEEITKELRQMLEREYDAIRDNFRFSGFQISIEPCGYINAYSFPDIVICSELVNDLISKGAFDALVPVLHHELAHTLLHLWRDNRAENEDVADELGLMLTLAVHDRKAAERGFYKLAEWFSTLNTADEYQHQVLFGGRHSLSIQRIKKIQAALQDSTGSEILTKWFQYLAPHMTDAALLLNVESEDRLVVTAARSELRRRDLR